MRRTTCAPNRRTRRCVPDQPGTMPRPVSGSPSLICVSAMRISAAAASSSPPPSAWPFSAAISGTRSVASRSKTRWPKRTQAWPNSFGVIAAQALMSPPAENALPAPVRIATRTLRVGLDCIAGGAELLQHVEVEGIELFRPRHGDRGDRTCEGRFDARIRHGASFAVSAAVSSRMAAGTNRHHPSA